MKNAYEVETFEIEDATHGEANAMACDAEAAELIEKLGLAGQKQLQNPETLTRCPYPVAEEDDLLVFKSLNTERCAPEAYSLDAIHVRVMQVLAHATTLNFFTSFEIWYPKSARVQDPVLVAHRRYVRPGHTWETTDTHILARWGKALQPLEKLRVQAVEMLRAKAKQKIDLGLRKLNACADAVKTTHDLSFLSNDFYVGSPL